MLWPIDDFLRTWHSYISPGYSASSYCRSFLITFLFNHSIVYTLCLGFWTKHCVAILPSTDLAQLPYRNGLTARTPRDPLWSGDLFRGTELFQRSICRLLSGHHGWWELYRKYEVHVKISWHLSFDPWPRAPCFSSPSPQKSCFLVLLLLSLLLQLFSQLLLPSFRFWALEEAMSGGVSYWKSFSSFNFSHSEICLVANSTNLLTWNCNQNTDPNQQNFTVLCVFVFPSYLCTVLTNIDTQC